MASQREAGNAIDAHPAEIGILGQHLILTFMRGQKTRRIQPQPGRQFSQHGIIANIAALLEIGLEHRIHHRILLAMPVSEFRQPMRLHRIGRALLQVQPQGKARGSARGRHLRVQFLRAGEAAEFLRAIGRPLHPRARHVGVELIGVPMDIGVPAQLL